MFRMLKFLNSSKTLFPPVPVTGAAAALAAKMGRAGPWTPEKLLALYRQMDREGV